MKCYWWNRWLHKKRRNTDRIILFPILLSKAEERANEKYTYGSPEWWKEKDSIVVKLFELHKSLPGNEHWICDCSK